MGIFNKDKKDKGREKDKKKVVQDRFMRRALNANFPNAKSNDMLELSSPRLFRGQAGVIGKVTDRLVLGRGEFDKLYQQPRHRAQAHAIHLRRRRSSDGPRRRDDRGIHQSGAPGGYLAPVLGSKRSSKDEAKKDKTTQIKEIEARGTLKGAHRAVPVAPSRRAAGRRDAEDGGRPEAVRDR
jgi:hypothetical protein